MSLTLTPDVDIFNKMMAHLCWCYLCIVKNHEIIDIYDFN
jgi:hypothetical protein